MSKKKVLLRGVFINRDTNGEGVLKVGTTLIRVSTVMGILYGKNNNSCGERSGRSVNTNKVYVDVTAVFSKEGQLKPVSVKWQDGHIYEIQRITDIRRAASLKAGGAGMRYTCIIDGKESHLFYEDNNMWFVEGRAGA